MKNIIKLHSQKQMKMKKKKSLFSEHRARRCVGSRGCRRDGTSSSGLSHVKQRSFLHESEGKQFGNMAYA